MDSDQCIRQSHRTDAAERFLCRLRDTGALFTVTVLNYNSEGVYFVAPQPLSEDAIVLLYSRGGEFPDSASGNGSDDYETMAYARVRWCRILKNGQNFRYGVGAEYVVV